MQVEKVYLFPDNGGYLIEHRDPFVSLICGKRPGPLIRVIRFGVHFKAYWRVTS
jgi:hypothetical protein